MKKLNKVTTEVYKQLMAEATKLPELQRQYNGKPMFSLSGELKRVFKETDKDSPNFGKQMKEVTRSRNPVLVNHKTELVEIYKTKGQEGVNNYIAFCNQIAENTKAQQEAIETVNKQDKYTDKLSIQRDCEVTGGEALITEESGPFPKHEIQMEKIIKNIPHTFH